MHLGRVKELQLLLWKEIGRGKIQVANKVDRKLEKAKREVSITDNE